MDMLLWKARLHGRLYRSENQGVGAGDSSYGGSYNTSQTSSSSGAYVTNPGLQGMNSYGGFTSQAAQDAAAAQATQAAADAKAAADAQAAQDAASTQSLLSGQYATTGSGGMIAAAAPAEPATAEQTIKPVATVEALANTQSDKQDLTNQQDATRAKELAQGLVATDGWAKVKDDNVQQTDASLQKINDDSRAYRWGQTALDVASFFAPPPLRLAYAAYKNLSKADSLGDGIAKTVRDFVTGTAIGKVNGLIGQAVGPDVARAMQTVNQVSGLADAFGYKTPSINPGGMLANAMYQGAGNAPLSSDGIAPTYTHGNSSISAPPAFAPAPTTAVSATPAPSELVDGRFNLNVGGWASRVAAANSTRHQLI